MYYDRAFLFSLVSCSVIADPIFLSFGESSLHGVSDSGKNLIFQYVKINHAIFTKVGYCFMHTVCLLSVA